MACKKCGAELESDALYCTECGIGTELLEKQQEHLKKVESWKKSIEVIATVICIAIFFLAIIVCFISVANVGCLFS